MKYNLDWDVNKVRFKFLLKLMLILSEIELIRKMREIPDNLMKLGQVMRKRVLCHMRTTKVQISVRIRAVSLLR